LPQVWQEDIRHHSSGHQESEEKKVSGFENLLQKFGGANDDPTELPPPNKPGGLEAFIQKHGKVTEPYFFYNGTVELRYNVEDHVYFLVTALGNLVEQNGVTNTVGIIDKSFMLTPWAAKVAIQKLLRLMPTEMVNGVIRIKPLTFEEFTVIALEAKTAHKDKLDEASDIGHMAHKCIELSIKHAMLTDPDKIVRALIEPPADAQAMNAATSSKVWMDAHNVRWIETETKIYSKEHEYAGTMDGLALVDSCSDLACCPHTFKNRLSLIDWKSSNHLKIEYLFQTAGYKHAKMEEYPNLNIEDTWILRLGKSEEEAGKFEPWHMSPEEHDEDFAGFLACLALTRLVDKVSERMKAQKSGIRAVKKEQRETAKALKKEADKLQKAIEKAEKKRMREEEKVKVKAEAKAERERLKLAKHTAVVVPVAAQEVLADVAATPVQISKAFSEVVTLQYEEEHVVTVAPTYKIPMEG
jgi:hypothetical protein